MDTTNHIYGYPRVDLHRHLDGNVRLSTMLNIAQRHPAIQLPAQEIETLRPHAQIIGKVPSLVDFIAKFDVIQEVLVDYEAVRQITLDNMQDAENERLSHCELRFSPNFMALRHHLDGRKVVETICQTIDEQKHQFSCEFKLIVIMSRHLGQKSCMEELDYAIACKNAGVVAIDLAGDEANYPGELFIEHFERARAAGFRITCHAGEAAGPASVKQAVEVLGAERIGHGIRAIEDPEVIALLVDRNIPLEVCPTSNVHTSTVTDYRYHPLKKLMELGVRVTLNTDDPGISNINLDHEWEVAKADLLLNEEQLVTLAKTGWESRFC